MAKQLLEDPDRLAQQVMRKFRGQTPDGIEDYNYPHHDKYRGQPINEDLLELLVVHVFVVLKGEMEAAMKNFQAIIEAATADASADEVSGE